MLDRVLAALGVDGVQWRALVRVYLRMDFRARGGATKPGEDNRRSSPLVAITFGTVFVGTVFALIVAQTPDVLLSATLLTTYGALTIILLVLMDFTGLVVSPDDYMVLGARPISSRTYFASRLSAVLVYVAFVGAVLSSVPGLCYALWWHLGVSGFLAALVAVVLCDACAAVVIISIYVVLLTFVHPQRLRRAFSYLHLLLMLVFYGAYFLSMQAFGHSFLAELSFDDRPYLWLNPASWFAAFVRLAAEDAPARVWVGAGAAVAVTIACVPLAAGRFSLEYAQRLGETMAVADRPRTRRRLRLRLPTFRRAESRAVAMLIAAQFRFDHKFRMAILSIVPLIFFYLLLGLQQGPVLDPFVSGLRSAAGAPVYMAVVFMPMTLHSSLQYSDGWRAAWIFFATPASAAKLILAAKNFVAQWFLGGYLLLLAAIWSFYYERVWHAFFHAGMIGLLAHMLLQLAVLLRPALPFASEPRRAERTSSLYVVFLFGSLLAAIIPMFLPLVYERPPLLVACVVIMVSVTGALEFALRLRVNEAIGDLEFRA
jgi:hypothetical protein